MILFPLALINIYCLHSTAAIWWAATYNKRRKRGKYSLVYKMNSSLISVKIATIKSVQWDFFIRFLLCRTLELTLETFLKELLCDSDCSAGALSGTWRTCTLRWGFIITQSLTERYSMSVETHRACIRAVLSFQCWVSGCAEQLQISTAVATKMPSPPFNQHQGARLWEALFLSLECSWGSHPQWQWHATSLALVLKHWDISLRQSFSQIRCHRHHEENISGQQSWNNCVHERQLNPKAVYFPTRQLNGHCSFLCHLIGFI